MKFVDLSSLFGQYIWMIPYVLVYLFGVIYAMVNLSRCPGAATLAMVGLGILLVNIVGGTLLMSLILRAEMGPEMGAVLQGLSIVRSLAGALGTALVIFAVFQGRTVPASTYEPFPAKPMPPH